MVCESEFRGIDFLPKIAGAIGIVGIVFGMSGYVSRNPSVTETLASRQSKTVVDKLPAQPAAVNPATVPPPAGKIPAPLATKGTITPQVLPEALPSKAVGNSGGSAEGPIYICGAQTKKGTPCSRRVKGNVRCFQHTGMPAMLPPEKLRVG